MNPAFRPWLTGLLLASMAALPAAETAKPFLLHTRSWADDSTGREPLRAATIEWQPAQTALVLCDLWDHHWCRGAAERVAEMAPRANEFVRAARRQGALIVHCPSETMRFYEHTPQRRRALDAPRAPLARPDGSGRPPEGPLPIDASDGGCDDLPRCGEGTPWTREIQTIEMADEDAVTDSDEIYGLFRERGIRNVMILGVHLNLCVLGRSFGIRQLVQHGLQVVLVRDLTDTMYNSRQPPFVSHFTGNDLMIEHVERYWCPTISSTDLVGGQPFRFKADRRPSLVFLIGEDEYRTAETLPAFGRSELRPRGIRVTVLQDAAGDPGNFPGLEDALGQADVLWLSTRRRALPKPQLEAVRAYLASGRPLIGIRTASHAFAPQDKVRQELVVEGGRAEWPQFDPEVLGGHYQGHHGAGPRVSVSPASGAAGHPILAGVDPAGFSSAGSLYRTRPLSASATVLLMGAIAGQTPEPVAWVNAHGPRQARVFYTSLGHPDDFQEPAFRKLLLNALLWALEPPGGRTTTAPPS
jgi:nicotinamidase-related amidase